MKYVLGLDIGVASVGWGVIQNDDEELVIKESGVRLFPQRDASQNEERRGFRGIRRNKRRRNRRLNDLVKIMSIYGIECPEIFDNNPLELRKRGLSDKLEKEELFIALYNLVKHRGISYLEDMEDVKGDALKLMKSELEELKYPCLIQSKRLENYGEFRGTIVRDEEKINAEGITEKKTISYSNVFPTQAYLDEALKIINTQLEYYPEFSEFKIYKNMFSKDEVTYSENIMSETSDYSDEGFNLKQAVILLLRRKRKYYVGPGNENSRTNYGRFKTEKDENGDYKTVDNIFDELRGKCSIYNGKNGREALLRASRSSYTAQYFNCLNDLCNIKIDGEKLTKAQKEEIIENIKDSKTNAKLKFITKVCKCNEGDISGFRVDKDGKPLLHAFDEYRKLKKAVDAKIDEFKNDENIAKIEEIYTNLLNDKNLLNDIYDIATLNTDIENIKPAIQKLVDENKLNTDLQNFIIEYLNKECSAIKDWHNFSYQIMDELIPEMLDTGNEQQTCLTNMGYFKYDDHEMKEKNKIPIEDILDEIYNPVVQRAIRQTLRIVNELMKRYEFSDIVVEMPREKNDGDTKKAIEKAQKENEQELKQAIKFLGIEDKLLENDEVNYRSDYFKNHKQLALKLRLAYRQKKKCLYSGTNIDIGKLLKDNMAYEIDHIIPLSISFNDSQQNKVLVLNDENRLKSNKTAYKYMQSKGEAKLAEYINNVNDVASDKKFSNWKKNLLFKEDINKIDVRRSFINRNLNDTRYASREVLNQLERYFAAKGRDTKVKVVNGSFTSQFRKKYVRLDKDRDKNHAHHGVDALIVALTAINLENFNKVMDTNTGEIFDMESWSNMNENDRDNLIYGKIDYHVIGEKLKDAEYNMKFSWKVDKKINRAISDQTIYGTRTFEEEIYVVEKLDLYNDSDNTNQGKIKKLVEKLKGDSKSKITYLMELHDERTWNELKKVVQTYPGEDNPFKKYVEDNGEQIRKYSKKGNGPFIQILKYNSKKLGSHIDITKNDNAKNKAVLLSLKPFRADCFYDNNNSVFRIVQLYYSDFKFIKGRYQLDINKYMGRLKDAKILEEKQILPENADSDKIENVLHENSMEFRFSLFGNDIVSLTDKDDVEIRKRVKSFTHKNWNYVEVAPINSNKTYKYDENGDIEKEISQDFLNYSKYNLLKINTDILGNEHKVFKEKLILEFKLDNDKIL